VFYVELDYSGDPNFTFRIAKYPKQPATPRTITELGSNLEKLAGAYRLFDMRDAALLASAAHVRDALDLRVSAAVLATYGCLPVAGRAGVYMDRQTEDLAEYIRAFAPAPRTVLDWGAGLGRTAQEIQKAGADMAAGNLAWLLYEPIEESRTALEGMPHVGSLNTRILATRDQLAGESAGVVLLTNVLHVLNPKQWAEAIEDGWAAIRSAKKGVILATELFPLLAPERFAVPIRYDILEGLFEGLGFKVHTKRTTVHNSTAFCMVAWDPPIVLPPTKDIVGRVEDAWRNLRHQFLRSYAGLPPPSSASDKTELMNAAFGIATITGWLESKDAG
jgi:hypothetical protein